MILSLTQVAIGGAVGSVLRYLTTMAVSAPLGTAIVNVAGSFAMGVLFVMLADRPAMSPLLMAGILGGFTTFSAFSLDALKLWTAGQTTAALIYTAGSVMLSLVAVALGAAVAQELI
jgi:fluoride exporter